MTISISRRFTTSLLLGLAALSATFLVGCSSVKLDDVDGGSSNSNFSAQPWNDPKSHCSRRVFTLALMNTPSKPNTKICSPHTPGI